MGTLERKGCVACHSTDGSPRVGPTFRGLYGTKHEVVSDGAKREIVVDDAYVERALRDPDADVAVGFPRGNMPRFESLSKDDVVALTQELRGLSAQAPPPKTPSMVPFASSVVWFVGMHFILSSIPVRTRLAAKLKQGFPALYSIVIAFGLVGIIWHFREVPYVELWAPPRATRWVPILVMPIALLFMVLGFSTPNPTAVRQGEKAKDPNAVRGILAVTRHPALWGFSLWALAHLATNGELNVIILAMGILVLAIGGMLHIDSRRRQALGDAWTDYAERTSIVPFVAMARGKAKLHFKDIGVVRLIVTAVVYVGILHTHALLIGASPFP